MTYTLGNLYCDNDAHLPKTFTAIFTENHKWFPLIRNYGSIKQTIAEMISGDPTITFEFDPEYASISSPQMAFYKDSIDYFAKLDSGKHIQLTMANEFTWQLITPDVYLEHYNNLDDGISQGDWWWIWYSQKRKPRTKYALYDQIYLRIAGIVFP